MMKSRRNFIKLSSLATLGFEGLSKLLLRKNLLSMVSTLNSKEAFRKINRFLDEGIGRVKSKIPVLKEFFIGKYRKKNTWIPVWRIAVLIKKRIW